MRKLSAGIIIIGALAAAGCTHEAGRYVEAVPDSTRADTSATAELGRSAELVGGPLGDLALPAGALDEPYAEAVLVAADGGTVIGRALVAMDKQDAPVLYYRILGLEPGARYSFKVGSECGEQGGDPLGNIRADEAGHASGRVALDTADMLEFDDHYLALVGMGPAGEAGGPFPASCGSLELVGGEATRER